MARVRTRISNQHSPTRNQIAARTPVRSGSAGAGFDNYAAGRVAASVQAGSMLGPQMRTSAPRQPMVVGASSQWLPAVSSIHVAANMGTFVLFQGGTTGWLYQGGTAPRMVSITATQQGGPSGMLVRVGPAAVTAQNQSPQANRRAPVRQATVLVQSNPAYAVTGIGRRRSVALPWIMVMATWAPGGPSAEPFAQQVQVDQYFVLAPDQGAGPKVGDLGWLYVTGSGKPPKHVRVVEFRNEGITEMEVRVVDVPSVGGTVANPAGRRVPNQAGPGNLTAELPREPDPTAGCCFVESAGTYINPATGISTPTSGFVSCPGGTEQWFMHRRPIPTVTVGYFDRDGVRMVVVETGDGSFELPVCTQPPGTDTTPQDCCIDTTAMVLRCAEGDPWNGATVTALGPLNGGLQTFSFIDPVDGVQKNARLPVCNQPPPGKCCFDSTTSRLVCSAGDPRDGMAVTVQGQFTQPDGQRIVVVRLPDGSAMDAVVCDQPPDQCCYDVATGTLRCPRNSGLNGQQVSLVSMTRNPDGSIIAIVQIQGQSGVATFPVCDDRVSDCCYDAATQTLVCSGDAALHGTAAAVVASWNQNGQIWVWVAWAGGGARMPLCPGQKDCPPTFCCVNVETMRFVCPGRTDINGQPATLADIVNDGGFNWGVLADGSRLPLCGRDCPPPEMCPDCPGCPPGMWMSPDGTCTPPPECPPCPECPPGRGKDPCPPYPGGPVVLAPTMPFRGAMFRAPARANPVAKKPCCDECAKKRNPGECGGCKGKKSNPKIRPRLRNRVIPQKAMRRGPR